MEASSEKESEPKDLEDVVEKEDNDDNAQEEEVVEEENEHDMAFIDFVDNVDVKEEKDLAQYLEVKKELEEKRLVLQETLELCIKSLDGSSKQFLLETCLPVCYNMNSRRESKDKDINDILTSNHTRRTRCLKSMDDANTAWKERYEKVTANILGIETVSN
jgi:hypothetical protein